MPIGLLIGWTIGQFLAGANITSQALDQNNKARTEEAKRATFIVGAFGRFLMWTGFCAFLGTMIELIIR